MHYYVCQCIAMKFQSLCSAPPIFYPHSERTIRDAINVCTRFTFSIQQLVSKCVYYTLCQKLQTVLCCVFVCNFFPLTKILKLFVYIITPKQSLRVHLKTSFQITAFWMIIICNSFMLSFHPQSHRIAMSLTKLPIRTPISQFAWAWSLGPNRA